MVRYQKYAVTLNNPGMTQHAFYKVHLKGCVRRSDNQNLSSDTLLFTLPSLYRPQKTAQCVAAADASASVYHSSMCHVTFEKDGECFFRRKLTSGGNPDPSVNQIWLDDVHFWTDNDSAVTW
jgi:hypothetical protein